MSLKIYPQNIGPFDHEAALHTSRVIEAERNGDWSEYLSEYYPTLVNNRNPLDSITDSILRQLADDYRKDTSPTNR